MKRILNYSFCLGLALLFMLLTQNGFALAGDLISKVEKGYSEGYRPFSWELLTKQWRCKGNYFYHPKVGVSRERKVKFRFGIIFRNQDDQLKATVHDTYANSIVIDSDGENRVIADSNEVPFSTNETEHYSVEFPIVHAHNASVRIYGKQLVIEVRRESLLPLAYVICRQK